MKRMYGYYGGWGDYVSMAKRKARAEREISALKKKGRSVSPVRIQGRTIAKTFWGKSWCDNLGSYSDFENRLPRGRSYVTNGLVIDLQIDKGEIAALVSGSSVYKVGISISVLEKNRWQELVRRCSGEIGSLIELLQGRFSDGVMKVMVDRGRGLFPSPKKIKMSCSCPDGAYVCKHVAAVLYGVGARLDESPELLFRLRNVDHAELLAAAGDTTIAPRSAKTGKVLKSRDLSGVFGIDVDAGEEKSCTVKKPPEAARKSVRKRAPAQKNKTQKKRTSHKRKIG